MSLETWLAGLHPSKLNTVDASSALKGFYGRVADSVDGLKAVDSGAVIEKARTMASQVGSSNAVSSAISSVLEAFDSKRALDVATWLKLLASKLPGGNQLTATVEYLNNQSRLLVYAIMLLGLAVLAASVSNLVVALIHALGFSASGVAGGSPAARHQSAHRRGNVPRGSPFSSLQSVGARGPLSFGAKAAIVACLGGVLWYATSKPS